MHNASDGSDGLDRDSPVPLYLQIRQRLIGMIAKWPDPEEKFPTDEQLAQHFDVAKATVRQALADLAQSGLLTRRRGAGTFVVPPLVEKLRPNMNTEDQYELSGGAVSHQIHAFDTRPATAPEAAALQIDEGTPVLSLRRVRALAHVPVAIDERVMTAEIAGRLGLTHAAATSSIIDLVKRRLKLARAAWDLQARLAGDYDALLLQIRPEDPILVRSLTYFDDEETPILIGETRHRSDMVRCGFEMDLSASPRAGQVQSWTREALLAGPPNE